VPKADIPKEHLRAIDKDQQVHDFQITCSTRFTLSDGWLAASKIARPLAVRELVFIVFINDVALFTVISSCIDKSWAKGVWVAAAPFDALHPELRHANQAGAFRESVHGPRNQLRSNLADLYG
jgi:hypothetical protein